MSLYVSEAKISLYLYITCRSSVAMYDRRAPKLRLEQLLSPETRWWRDREGHFEGWLRRPWSGTGGTMSMLVVVFGLNGELWFKSFIVYFFYSNMLIIVIK